MSEFQEIIYQKHHRVRGAAWITINRPDVMNSFTGQTLTEMRQAVEDACADPEVGVIVITGAGDRAFCAGGDVRWLQEVQREGAAGPAPMDPHAGIEDCMKPVIARVNGYAIGGGNHLAYFSRLHDRLGERDLRSGRPARRQPGLRLPRLLPHARRRRQEGEGDLDALPPLQRAGGAGDGARQRRRPARQAGRGGRPLVRRADAEEPRLPEDTQGLLPRRSTSPCATPPGATGSASSRPTSSPAARPTRARPRSWSAASPTSPASRARHGGPPM